MDSVLLFDALDDELIRIRNDVHGSSRNCIFAFSF